MNPVRIMWRLWPALLLAVASGLGAAAKPTGNPASADYSPFKIITARNIFNANRTSRPPRQAAPKPPKIESFALTGTLSYEKGTFAFFDGTSSTYRKVLQPEGTIAGYKVMEISPEAATLEANGRQIELRVGGQLRRADKGEWEIAANPIAYASSAKRKSAASARSSRSSTANDRHAPPPKHKRSGGPDSGQYSKKDKKEISAFLKAENETYSKEEMKSFSKDEMQGYSKDDVKDMKEALKQEEIQGYSKDDDAKDVKAVLKQLMQQRE